MDHCTEKREAFRAAFDNFDPQKVALYDDAKVEALMADAGIIRHRGKINAAIGNAKAFLEIQKEYGSFDRFIWDYVGGVPIINAPHSMEDLPVSTPLSDQISKDLKKRGFKFVGSTIVYSFMQAGVAVVQPPHLIWGQQFAAAHLKIGGIRAGFSLGLAMGFRVNRGFPKGLGDVLMG